MPRPGEYNKNESVFFKESFMFGLLYRSIRACRRSCWSTTGEMSKDIRGKYNEYSVFISLLRLTKTKHHFEFPYASGCFSFLLTMLSTLIFLARDENFIRVKIKEKSCFTDSVICSSLRVCFNRKHRPGCGYF